MTAVEDRASEVQPEPLPGSVLDVLGLYEEYAAELRSHVALLESLTTPDGVLRAFHSLSLHDQQIVNAQNEVIARQRQAHQLELLGIVDQYNGLREQVRHQLGPDVISSVPELEEILSRSPEIPSGVLDDQAPGDSSA
jgi:hypothetical protein